MVVDVVVSFLVVVFFDAAFFVVDLAVVLCLEVQEE